MSLFVTKATSTTPWLGSNVTGDTQNRYTVEADGKILWGPGNASADVILQRSNLVYFTNPLLTLYRGDGTTPGDLQLNSICLKNNSAIITLDKQVDENALELPTEWVPNPSHGYSDLGYGNLLFKNTSPAPENCEFKDGVYTSLFLVMVQDPSDLTNFTPILATDHGFWVEKDLQTYGALFCLSDPAKGYGGGAILLGHGFQGEEDPPQIILIDSANPPHDTLYLRKFGGTNPAQMNLGNLFLQEGFIEWTNGEHDSVGSFYPTDIVYTPYVGSAAANKLEFFVSNGQYSAGTKAGRQNLAMTLRGDGVVIAEAGYMCIQGSSTKSLNLWDSNENTVAYFAHDGSNAYINANGTLFLNGSSGLVAPPSTHNVWCGQASTSGYAWAGVAGNYIYSHSSYTGHYDEYDDLSFVKSYKLKKAMINDPVTNEKTQRTVIDVPASFPFLVNEHGFMHVGDTFGYTVGCLKQVALKLDEHDANLAEVANLKNEVASLKAQVETLAKATA